MSTLDPVIKRLDFMPEELSGFVTICRKSWEVSEDRGWHEPRTRGPMEVHPRDASVTERLMLVVSELVEAMEEMREGKDLNEIYYGDDGKPEGFPIEIADAVIRIGDLCHHYGIPIGKALNVKQRFNQTRPVHHGGKVL